MARRPRTKLRRLPALLLLALVLYVGYNGMNYRLEKAWQEEMYRPGTQGKVVVIDPGHGGADPGAQISGINESDVNLSLARALKTELARIGVTAILTREETGELVPREKMSYYERGRNLVARREVALDERAHLFISIHNNVSSSRSTRGGIVFYTDANPYSNTLAKQIQRQINTYWTKERTVEKKGFTVIAWNKIPSVLVEVGFLTNPGNRAKLTSPEGQNEIARQISLGIQAYFASLPGKNNA